MKKGRLQEIVKELRAASKMHAGQADEISEHVKDMALPMRSPLNIKKSKSHKENKTTTLAMKSPLNFKGANSKNSKCWEGKKKCGTKPSPSGTGETVNDCRPIPSDGSDPCKKK